MTPSEYQSVRGAIIRIWPRVAQRMTETDWKIIGQRCMGLNITPVQADAALEELRATDDKYPTPAKILTTLKRLDVRPARTADHAVAASIGPGARLAQYRRLNGLPEDASPSDAVKAEYIQAANRAIRLRGYLHESWFDHARNDLIELAGWGLESAEAWTVEIGGQYPHTPPMQSVHISHIRDLASQRIGGGE